MLDILLALYLLFAVSTGIFYAATAANASLTVRFMAIVTSPLYAPAVWLLWGVDWYLGRR